MVQIWGHGRSVMILILLAPVQTDSRKPVSQNQMAYVSGVVGTAQPGSAATTETAGDKVTADQINPADGSDGQAHDHHHGHDYYKKHGRAKDRHERNANMRSKDHEHDEGEKEHELHSRPFTITRPGYDIRDRPRDADIREPVLTQLHAYSDFIETINEKDGEMVVKLFIQATWRDNRIRPLPDILDGLSGFNRNMLPLPGEIKDSIWVPDLYLPVARHVSIPTIHQPAESITLKPNGTLRYSAFFVIAFKCQMSYSNYPMDVQDCNLDIMSYRHSSDELRLRWHPAGFTGKTSIATKHFHVTVLRPKGKSALVHKYPNGTTRDVLRIKYFLKRHLTFHLLQTYVPSIMLVIIGWLSLLVPLDFAYGRMVLSVTTLLVLVSIFVTTSQTTPGVNEVKALDVWLFMCIFFVFSAIVDCIVDLRFLSMVEKESQIAGEAGADGAVPPIVDERLRASRGNVQHSTLVGDTHSSYSVKFHGNNTPFQADKEVLIATPAVLKWLRLAVFLERGMTVIYPTLFVLFMAIYWSIYLTARNAHPIPESEDWVQRQ